MNKNAPAQWVAQKAFSGPRTAPVIWRKKDSFSLREKLNR